jgi:hypothetical protein
MVFIDGANLFFEMINNGINPKLNYEKFVKKLVTNDRKLIRSYYYDAHIDQTENPERYSKQQSFFGLSIACLFSKLKRGVCCVVIKKV